MLGSGEAGQRSSWPPPPTPTPLFSATWPPPPCAAWFPGPALPLGLHVLEHTAQVPGLQHADHHVQRGHLATVVKSSGCVLSSARPGEEMLLHSHFREKGTDSQKCGPHSWPGMSPEVLTIMPPRSLQSPCQDHTGLHLPLLPSSLHTPATGPRGSLLVSTAGRTRAAVPRLRGLPTDLSLQDTALGATHPKSHHSCSSEVPPATPPPTPE